MASNPLFALPAPKKIDMEAMLGLYKANIETFVAAQRIMFDFTQLVAKRQVELMKDAFSNANGMVKTFDAKKQPVAYVDDAKFAIEKAMAEVKETMDLGVRAQHEVVDLLVKRATANFDEVKSLAAAA